MSRRDASTAPRSQKDELTKKTFYLTPSPCDFLKLREWSSCDYMSSVLESGHWLKSGRGGRKQENILLRFSCVRLISPSSFTHLWKVMFSRHRSCPVPGSRLLPRALAGWTAVPSAGWGGAAFVLGAVIAFSASRHDLCRCFRWDALVGVTLWVLVAWRNEAVGSPGSACAVANPLHQHRLRFVHLSQPVFPCCRDRFDCVYLHRVWEPGGGVGHHLTLENGGFAKLVQLQFIPLLSPSVMSFSCSVER